MKMRPINSSFRIDRHTLLATLIVCIWTIAFPDLAKAASLTCTPEDGGVFPGKRIHVQCTKGDGDIKWFALGVSNDGDANRMLSILSTAFALQKKLTIWYEPGDTSGSSIGCKANDCRLIEGARIF
jgi:hypothetical protein